MLCVVDRRGLACGRCKARKTKCSFASHGKAAPGATARPKGKEKEPVEPPSGPSEAEPPRRGRRRRASTLEGDKRKRQRRTLGTQLGHRLSFVRGLVQKTMGEFEEASHAVLATFHKMGIVAGRLQEEFEQLADLARDADDEETEGEWEGEEDE